MKKIIWRSYKNDESYFENKKQQSSIIKNINSSKEEKISESQINSDSSTTEIEPFFPLNNFLEHGNYQTASMDVKNRILRLPIWKEMSGSLYDLMVLHEVGHALYTPEDGWHESASSKGHGYKSFLNVVEDARIERKIKDK